MDPGPMDPGDTVRPWLDRHAILFDAVYGVALAVTILIGTVAEADALQNGKPILPHPGTAAYALVVIASLVLIWRRRWPLATFAVSLAAVAVYTGLGYVDGSALIAPCVALYTAAVVSTPQRAALLTGITLVMLGSLNMASGPFGWFGGPILVLPFEVVATLAVALAVRNRRAVVAEIRDRAERAERTREEEARRRVDTERLRIARELHDVVAHSISVINVQARVAAQVIPDPPPAGEQALTAIKQASAEALRELRAMLGLLRQADEAAPTAPAPSLDQLDVLVSAAANAGLVVKVATIGEPYRLPPTVELAAYRIVQESLTNAVRHAGPTEAVVSLRYNPGALVVEIDDDGRGLLAVGGGAPHGHFGYGITGMRERAMAVGGTLEAGPKDDRGFRVRAKLPVIAGS